MSTTLKTDITFTLGSTTAELSRNCALALLQANPTSRFLTTELAKLVMPHIGGGNVNVIGTNIGNAWRDAKKGDWLYVNRARNGSNEFLYWYDPTARRQVWQEPKRKSPNTKKPTATERRTEVKQALQAIGGSPFAVGDMFEVKGILVTGEVLVKHESGSHHVLVEREGIL